MLLRPSALCREVATDTGAKAVAAPASPPVSSLSLFPVGCGRRFVTQRLHQRSDVGPGHSLPLLPAAWPTRARLLCSVPPELAAVLPCPRDVVRTSGADDRSFPATPAPCASDDAAGGCLVGRLLVEGEPGLFLASRNALVIAPWAHRRLPRTRGRGSSRPESRLSALSGRCFPVSVSRFAPFRGQTRPGAGGLLPFPPEDGCPTSAPAYWGQPRLQAPKYWGMFWLSSSRGDPRPSWLAPAPADFFGHINLSAPPLPSASICRYPPPTFDPTGPAALVDRHLPPCLSVLFLCPPSVFSFLIGQFLWGRPPL